MTAVGQVTVNLGSNACVVRAHVMGAIPTSQLSLEAIDAQWLNARHRAWLVAMLLAGQLSCHQGYTPPLDRPCNAIPTRAAIRIAG